MFFRVHFTQLWLAVLLTIPTAISSTSSRPQNKVPGVGFSLAPDYGTAAIYFQNGSSVAVARIEGSPAYKSFMRRLETRNIVGEQTYLSYYLRSMACQPLQPFDFGFCRSDPDMSGVQGLLRSLQSSVHSYLGTAFCFAGIVVPDRTWVYQSHLIEEAVKSIGLRQTHRILDASHMALLANNVGSSMVFNDGSQAILSVDYSASGLNVALFAEDGGVVDIIRRSYNQQLGGSHQGKQNHLKNVAAVLKEIIKPPFSNDPSGSPITDGVQHVVLYGDMAMETEFQYALRDSLGSNLIDEAHSFSPVYAASIGMAKASHQRMDDLDFNVEPAFGCRWRSSLYVTEREEL